ncbi:MAG: hypothetical protein ABJD66_03110 [Cellulophaga sp.]|uniref:DUF6909 family protein n=1 Tax=unclassified Cellulophaga TaxID=2634405 RepID=UPI000C2BD5FA|nr:MULTISPECIES: hypothetical protein [unclassified Cellulophaga]MDO6489746.1 hypothetical protein [Cellulophaga sp. 2_MG-2023]MDO6495060.1 hypothetical protein [Cellulophaga sp. 3_MG-2023]PKB42628.1 hypothetical protein AX016_0796 [Cellulophaga sp. RHA19]
MNKIINTTRAQESTNAIERLYITMRHLFNRGFYKPMGVSGETLRNALLQLRPEIYGSVGEEKSELNGLTYVLERLPEGIEQCRYINLTSDEGYGESHFKAIIPAKRRRDCYRIDEDQMNIVITRGRSDIYDILTHLTFLFIESEKICKRVLIEDTKKTIRDWTKLETALESDELSQAELEVALSYTANILGRSFVEVKAMHQVFATKENPEKFLRTIYWMGKLAIEEETLGDKRIITFSPVLRERLGHHIHGDLWALTIKETLEANGILHRPIHIISANMHSVMNSLFAKKALAKEYPNSKDSLEIYEDLSKSKNDKLRAKVTAYAKKNGMISLNDTSGTNIDVQIFDSAKFGDKACCFDLPKGLKDDEKPVIFVMDYAFGEQAYETIDELLKPYEKEGVKEFLNVESVSIMGKAGILEGGKGDIMIATAHIFEGTADNYPFKNELSAADFEGHGLKVLEGTMVTVLGTSLQNKNILQFFKDSTWGVIGLEMEGVHYQKAIQAASKIRKSIKEDVKVRYAYYASDNPLETGSTLASGGLGTTGVKPTYLITDKILKQLFNS